MVKRKFEGESKQEQQNEQEIESKSKSARITNRAQPGGRIRTAIVGGRSVTWTSYNSSSPGFNYQQSYSGNWSISNTDSSISCNPNGTACNLRINVGSFSFRIASCNVIILLGGSYISNSSELNSSVNDGHAQAQAPAAPTVTMPTQETDGQDETSDSEED